jgi:hypothetical protein
MKIESIEDIKNNIKKLKLFDIFVYSINFNYLDGVKYAFSNGFDITYIDDYIIDAVKNNSIEIVKYLIEIKICKNYALDTACRYNNLEIAKFLIDNYNFDYENISFSFYLSIVFCHFDIADYFLKSGYNLEKNNYLIHITVSDNFDSIKYLILHCTKMIKHCKNKKLLKNILNSIM